MSNQHHQRMLIDYLRRGKKNKPVWLIVVIVIVWLLGEMGWVGAPSPSNNMEQGELQEVIADFNGHDYNNFPKMTKIPVEYLKSRDGDTVVVSLNNYELSARYLIIDTPEMNYDTGHPDPYAELALETNHALLSKANQVYIMFDEGPYTDNYQRLLVYMYADDILMNEYLVSEGLATVRYVNPPNDTYADVLYDAQSEAKDAQLYLWDH